MRLTAAPLTARQQAWDVLTGGACTIIALAVHVTGAQAVSQNQDPSAVSVALTVLAVAPLGVRRRAPLSVLTVTFLGLIGLVATHSSVGASTIGSLGAFYTALALSPRDLAWAPVAVSVSGIGIGLAMHPADLSPSGGATTATAFAVAGALGYSVRERREHFEADVAASQARAAHAVTDERLRITRELHDIIGHAMSVMVVQAGVAERLLETDPSQARQAVARIGATGRASLAEMRQVLASLRETSESEEQLSREPTPGIEDIAGLTARVQQAGLPVDLVEAGPARPLPPGLELAAYRIVQEALTNTLKHARASSANVRLEYADNSLLVVVDDDGRVAASSEGPAGHGLVGMRERVQVFGGELRSGPRPSGGWRVEATLPTGTEVPR